MTATTYTLPADGITARGMSSFQYTINEQNAKSTPSVHSRLDRQCGLLGSPVGRLVLMRLHLQSGVTLIELLVALAIAALLVSLAIPSYTLWISDAQIRSAAESVAGGLRYAQGEAIKRNSQVEFVIDPTTGTGGWLARLVADGSTLQAGPFAEGASQAVFKTFDVAGGAGASS